VKTYYPAAKIINDTSEHLGRYGKVMALQDSVITVGIDFDTIEDFDAVVSLDNFYINGIIGDNNNVPLKAGCEIVGVFSTVLLDSGTVIAYRL
jgi:hypothetical protein